MKYNNNITITLLGLSLIAGTALASHSRSKFLTSRKANEVPISADDLAISDPTLTIQPIRQIKPILIADPIQVDSILVDRLPIDPPALPVIDPVPVDPYFAGICTAAHHVHKMSPKSVSMSCLCYWDGTCKKT